MGDSLSPLIFNLYMAIISAFIEETCTQGRWKAINFNNQLPVILHMVFADNIVGEANFQSVRNMINAIEWFCQASGQQINFVKSQVIYALTHCQMMQTIFLFQEKVFLRNEGTITYLSFSFIKNGITITLITKSKQGCHQNSWIGNSNLFLKQVE